MHAFQQGSDILCVIYFTRRKPAMRTCDLSIIVQLQQGNNPCQQDTVAASSPQFPQFPIPTNHKTNVYEMYYRLMS